MSRFHKSIFNFVLSLSFSLSITLLIISILSSSLSCSTLRANALVSKSSLTAFCVAVRFIYFSSTSSFSAYLSFNPASLTTSLISSSAISLFFSRFWSSNTLIPSLIGFSTLSTIAISSLHCLSNALTGSSMSFFFSFLYPSIFTRKFASSFCVALLPASVSSVTTMPLYTSRFFSSSAFNSS